MTSELTRGSRGEEVRLLQIVLRSLGYYKTPAAIDGVFGPKTETAVRMFQAARWLVVDGVVGPVTNAALKLAQTAPTQLARTAAGFWVPRERCWPLRALADGRHPVVTSQHAVHNPTRPNHYGVDLLYPYKDGDPPMKVGDGGRTSKWWIPEGQLAVAAAAGIVMISGNSATGWRCWVKHDGDLSSGYFHLSKLADDIRPGRVLFMGDPVGIVGDSPRGDDPKHLHFENYIGDIFDDVKHGRYPRGTIDPEPWLHGAAMLAAA